MYVFSSGPGGVEGVYERIGFGLYQTSGNGGSVGRVSVFGLLWCMWGVGKGLGPGSRGVPLASSKYPI